MRQTASLPSRPDGSVVVRTNPVTFPTGYKSSTHRHEWDQLTYASRGTITVETEGGFWALPPHRAVWVPAGLAHREEMSAPSTVRTLYFAPGSSSRCRGNAWL